MVKKRNGHDPGTERIVEVLERIEKDLSGLRDESRKTNARLDGLREELHEFRAETRDELLDLHAEQREVRVELHALRVELHALRTEVKTSVEPRLVKLEAVVFPPPST